MLEFIKIGQPVSWEVFLLLLYPKVALQWIQQERTGGVQGFRFIVENDWFCSTFFQDEWIINGSRCLLIPGKWPYDLDVDQLHTPPSELADKMSRWALLLSASVTVLKFLRLSPPSHKWRLWRRGFILPLHNGFYCGCRQFKCFINIKAHSHGSERSSKNVWTVNLNEAVILNYCFFFIGQIFSIVSPQNISKSL